MARMRRRREPEPTEVVKKRKPTVETHRPALELDKTVRLLCSKPAQELQGLPTAIRNKLKEFSADARAEKAVIVKQLGGPPTGSVGRVITAIKTADRTQIDTLQALYGVSCRQLENAGFEAR